MRNPILCLVPLLVGLQGCIYDVTEPEPETDTGPYVTFRGSLNAACPSVRPKTVLVDPTHDGGTWWFPQHPKTPGAFRSDSAHQGKALADYLRAQGYTVAELVPGATMSADSMMAYSVIIRAGYYADEMHPGYAQPDLDAYAAYTGCARTVILLAEYLRPGHQDLLANSFGIPLEGLLTGTITTFTSHAITDGVSSIPYMAGSFLSNESNASIQVLGRVDSKAVMGVLNGRVAKVFFIGDVNGIEQVPQPFVQRLVAWGF